MDGAKVSSNGELMADKVDLHFKYTADEYAAAARMFMLRTPAIIVRLGIFITLFTLGIFMLLAAFDTDLLLPLFGTAAIFTGLVAGLFFGLPKQRFQSDPKYRDEYFLEFSDAGILFKTDHIDAQVRWNLYTDVLEDERFYVLVYGKNMFSVIPKRAFKGPQQEARFRELLRRNLAPELNARWLREGAAKELEDAYVPPPEPPDWR